MRKFIDIVTEAQKPTKTRDRTKLDLDLMPHLDKGAVSTVGGSKKVSTTGSKKQKQQKPRIPGRPADRPNDMTPTGHGDFETLGRHMRDFMSHGGMDMRDEISDDEAMRLANRHRNPDRLRGQNYLAAPEEPVTDLVPFDTDDTDGTDIVPYDMEPHTLDQLPAVIRHDVVETGEDWLNPRWQRVTDLPNYVVQGIRAMGRAVFREFTNTPLEEFWVLAAFNRNAPVRSPNSEQEVMGMMEWIRSHAVRDDAASVDFSGLMPGYEPEVSIWRTEDYAFLLVRDHFGVYIYGAEGGRGFRLNDPTPPRRLR